MQLQQLFYFLKPYRRFVIAIMALVFIENLLYLYLPTMMADIVDIGVIKGDTPYILRMGGFMLLIAGAGMVCAIMSMYISAKVAAKFGKTIRANVFEHVQYFTLQEFDQLGTASLITRTTNDINQVQQLLTFLLRMMIMAPLMCIGGIVMAVSKDAKLSTIFIIVIPVLIGFLFVIVRKGMPLFSQIQERLDQLNLILREGLTGIRVIRSFNQTQREKQRFHKANDGLRITSMRVNRIMGTMMPTMMLIMNLSLIAIVWFGSIRIDQGHMQIGALMAFLEYAMQIMFSLMMVSMLFVFVPRATVSAERINEVLQMEHVVENKKQTLQTTERKGVIQFQDVTFRYPGAEKPALEHISFVAKPGEVTAIIGGTGSGKSTLVNLIPRFYDIEKGEIRVDGIDIRDLTQEDLRSRIGLVPQKANLFSGTIAENIRMGMEQATDEEVAWAAQTAQAQEFIQELDKGFDAPVTQRGSNLSGGQQQRLSIARAIVRKPNIYIFDDSFSALDFKTDAKLRSALKQETIDSTVLIVAQRVTTVMEADQIIVLDSGSIVGVGKHQELIDTCEVYREIVSSQLTEEEIA